MSELKMRRPTRWLRKAASTRRRRADVLTVARDGKVERRKKDKQGSRGNLPCWVSNGAIEIGLCGDIQGVTRGGGGSGDCGAKLGEFLLRRGVG
jgi:hypothetical protein